MIRGRYQDTNAIGPAIWAALAGASESLRGDIDRSRLGRSCAVTKDGTVLCWGENGSGQIGVGLDFEVLAPTALGGERTVRPALATGIDPNIDCSSTGFFAPAKTVAPTQK